MKNILCLFGFLLILTGCSRTAPRYRIAVSQCSDDEWRTKMNNEILREAQFYDGVEVEIRSVKDDNKQQIADIRYFIDQQVDLLIVAPNEAVPLTPIIEEAYGKNIPVIVIDRTIFSDKYTAFVGADNFEIGRSVGNYVVSRFTRPIHIVELTGLSGSTPAIDRHQGFTSVISRYPHLNLIDVRDAGWNTEDAEWVMEEILAIHPRIDLLFSQNDRMAAGAYATASRLGREKEMIFLGIDALPGEGYGLDLVLKNILDATFIYPTDGDKVLRLAMDILEGRPYERENTLFTAAIDWHTAQVMKQQSDYIEDLDNRIGFLNNAIDQFLLRLSNQQMILYATVVILALSILIVGLMLKAYHTKLKLNRKLSERNQEITNQKEQLETQRDQLLELSKQLEEATHAKLVFFTNISHDFRTPLTLIADPVNQLLEDKSIPEQPHTQLKLVRKNVNILLRLVNQILDFRKYENGKLDLVPIRFDMKEQLDEWTSAFHTIALKKHIKFRTEIDPGIDYKVTADLGKIERVCYNLLSNAFKFTPENGKIQVHLSASTREGINYICVSVSDTGIGISPQHVQNIFERFYMTDYQYAGSGIGLALTKAFIELHNGEIMVESREGTGSVFTFRIPVEQPEYTIETIPEIITLAEPDPAEVMESILPAEEIREAEDEPEVGTPTLLIIDDNADIRMYIRSVMGQRFTIIEAENGKEGVKKAMKYVPDVVICDVLMPVMDGIDCCRVLKTEMQTSHIPVIMLTACSLDEQRIKGFETGADSYIAKPFNSKVLEARVWNLLNNRRHLKQFFGDNTSLAKEVISDLDKEFVEKFRKLIEENISNSAFSVEDMGESMGMSRVQVYRKIKSLTNYSPNELLRITRLKKAATLLASSEMTIAEITYEVGFTSPSYFTKCYKEHFGENPKDLRNKVK